MKFLLICGGTSASRRRLPVGLIGGGGLHQSGGATGCWPGSKFTCIFYFGPASPRLVSLGTLEQLGRGANLRDASLFA